MHYRSGNPTSVLQGSATNYKVANYLSLSRRLQARKKCLHLGLFMNTFKCNFKSGQNERDTLTNETTRRDRYLTVAAPPKSLHHVRREAHSMAVHLEVDVATSQRAPSPPSHTLSRNSHGPARRTSGSAWLWLRLARPDPKSQCHR